MKLKFNRSDVLSAIKRVAGAVPNTSPLEIVTHMLVTVRDGHAKWTGGRVDAQLTATTAVECNESGTFTLPARKFNALLAGLQGVTDITLDVDNETAVLRAGRSRYTLRGLDPAGYPVLTMTAKTTLILDSGKLATMMAYVQPCITSGTDPRPWTMGISLRARGNKLEAMAMEATRLAYASEVAEADDGEVMIHRDSVPLVLGVLQHANSVWIGIDDTKYKMIVGDYEIVASRLNATTPDVSKFAFETRNFVYVGMAEMKAAVARMMIFAEDNNRCTITMTANELRMHSGASDQADETVMIESGDGFQAEAHVSIAQIKDALDASSGDQIGIGLPDFAQGTVFVREREDATRHMLMTQLRV